MPREKITRRQKNISKLLRYRKKRQKIMLKSLRKEACFILAFFVFFTNFASANDNTFPDQKNRPKIGVVLGGGGARGAAHISVLKALEKYNVPVDYITGTSMGAVIAGGYASGMSPEAMEKILEDINWGDLFSSGIPRKYMSFRNKEDQKDLIEMKMGYKDGKIVLPQALVGGQKLDFFLQSMSLKDVDIQDFNDLPVPFWPVATDVETGERVALKKGNLAQAVRASMAIPGVLAPVEINGRVFVDGSLTDNIPIDVIKEMGADIVIAVDVGVPLATREELETFADVTMQMIGIMTLQNVRHSLSLLTKKDLLITLDFDRNITTQDYAKTAQIINIGDKLTEDKYADSIQKYSIPKEKYQLYLKRQDVYAQDPQIMVDFIDIDSAGKVSQKAILAKMRTKPGQLLNTNILKDDLDYIYDIGGFSEVDFEVIEKDGKTGLLIITKENPYGYNIVQFGLQVSENFSGDSYYNLLLQYKRTQVNRLGAEWKNRLQIGRTTKVFSEFYQPLNYDDSLFIAPRFQYVRNVSDVYSNKKRIAEYLASTVSGAIDAGFNLGTSAEGRAGFVIGRVDAESITGDEGLPKFDLTSVAFETSFIYDQLDDVNFPRHGIQSGVQFFMPREEFGSDDSYSKLMLNALGALSYKKHTLLINAEYGDNLGNEIPFYDEYTLGGFLNLSGYRNEELTGQNACLGQLIYYYQVFKAPVAFVDAVYLGCSLEAGNVWDKRSDMRFDKLLIAGSAFVGLDTMIGPVYLAYGLAQKAKAGQIYLFVGKRF